LKPPVAKSGSLLAFQVRVAEDVAGAFSVSVTLTVLVSPPPVTVIVAELLPWLAFAVFTLTVIVPLVEPDVGLIVNQEAEEVLLADQDPFDVTVTDWFAGLAAP